MAAAVSEIQSVLSSSNATPVLDVAAAVKYLVYDNVSQRYSFAAGSDRSIFRMIGSVMMIMTRLQLKYHLRKALDSVRSTTILILLC